MDLGYLLQHHLNALILWTFGRFLRFSKCPTLAVAIVRCWNHFLDSSGTLQPNIVSSSKDE